MSIHLHIVAVDPSIGRIDKSTLSQQTLMELLIAGMTNTECIYDDADVIPEISEWHNIEFDANGNVTEIHWYFAELEGALDLQWIPPTAVYVDVDQNDLEGTLDLTCLPDNLRILNVGQNRFFGSVDLTRLPSKMEQLHLSINNFKGRVDLRHLPSALRQLDLSNNFFEGHTDFSKLPGSLTYINVSRTALVGEIMQTEGLMIDIEYSDVKIST